MPRDIDALLNVHEAQGAPRAVVAFVRSLREAEAEIDGSRYQPARAAELKRERRAKAVAEIAAEVAGWSGRSQPTPKTTRRSALGRTTKA